MKLQIISALIFLFFMILFSFVNLQITPTRYGTQITFGQELQPVDSPATPTPVIAMGECYSTVSELKEQKNTAMLAVIGQNTDQQLQELETLIEKLTTTSNLQQHSGTMVTNENLP